MADLCMKFHYPRSLGVEKWKVIPMSLLLAKAVVITISIFSG